MGNRIGLVTEYVPGAVMANDEMGRAFLTDVSEVFDEGGLSVWQLTSHNPHSRTNVIRTSGGHLKIIDLESGLPTPFPPWGQWRFAIKSGNIPIFDDVDFSKLRGFFGSNLGSLEQNLGDAKIAELQDAV